MASTALDALKDWHDFYIVLGTASATLIGAMFIVVSIGSGYLTEERAVAARPFLTPTTIHLATVLFGCALILAPSLGWLSFGLIYGLGSAAGLAYSAVIAMRVRRRNVDIVDRIWYGLVPLLGYAVIAWAAAMALRRDEAAVDVLAAGFITILLAGMRNAWDMIFFLITRERDSH
jgi:hypothetical protein